MFPLLVLRGLLRTTVTFVFLPETPKYPGPASDPSELPGNTSSLVTGI